MREPQREDERRQNIGILQPRITEVLSLDLAIFLENLSQRSDERLLRRVRRGLLIHQAGGDERLLAAHHVGQRGDQLAVLQVPVGARNLRQGSENPGNQMLVLMEELLADAHGGEHLFRRVLRKFARLLVLTRLLQVGAFWRAFQSNFALLTATLSANAIVQGETKTFFFAQVTDWAAQPEHLGDIAGIRETLLLWHLRATGVAETRMDVAFSSAPVEKTA